ncbi:hypothetical protein TRIATDRAFT_259281 [Trichoderma atroviride IMI 206040]|uniref:Uncharacterized protein n=1 Tax=Hypocrea atroviridis (strain ATCC 20476 / IMI 206040) TaxID=452589 RepID=G9P5S8_HYPAI|nr:uncharacterized protein TRIATDRAFT_259281 [Trichoderma atroviride IMI 206040]EHK41370.1 hypothetical protein TRIATDRAFT_259281 [Trichoderma atroviride IMI 206040]
MLYKYIMLDQVNCGWPMTRHDDCLGLIQIKHIVDIVNPPAYLYKIPSRSTDPSRAPYNQALL